MMFCGLSNRHKCSVDFFNNSHFLKKLTGNFTLFKESKLVAIKAISVGRFPSEKYFPRSRPCCKLFQPLLLNYDDKALLF